MCAKRGATTAPIGGIGRALPRLGLVGLCALAWAPAPPGAWALPLAADTPAASAPEDADRSPRRPAQADPLDLSRAPLSFSLEPDRRPAVFFDMGGWSDGLAATFGLAEPGFGLGQPLVPAAPDDGVALASEDEKHRQTPLPGALPLLGIGLTLLALAARRWWR